MGRGGGEKAHPTPAQLIQPGIAAGEGQKGKKWFALSNNTFPSPLHACEKGCPETVSAWQMPTVPAGESGADYLFGGLHSRHLLQQNRFARV